VYLLQQHTDEREDKTMEHLLKNFKNGLEWPVVIFIAVIHILAISLCLLFYSKEGAFVLFILYLLTGLGITIGYHRKLTHQSFKSPKFVDYALAVLGILAGQGPPIFWVAHHRKHHKYSDEPEDSHSPTQGFWWAHWLWLFSKLDKMKLGILYKKWAPDLLKDKFFCFLERSYLYWHLGVSLALLFVGYYIGSWYLAISFFVYGFCIRMVLLWHATWLVNSAGHTWGYRNYETKDKSQNNAFVGIVAHGEGWHNNHHYVQGSANHGHRWWEFDLSFIVIIFVAILMWPLAWIGLGKWRLAYRIKVYSIKQMKVRTFFR